MKLKLPLGVIYAKLKKTKKENLLTFGLLSAAGILVLIPGFTFLLHTFSTKIPANQNDDWLVARSVLSLFMMLPSFVLFCIGYLLLESHSIGWKLSLGTCGASILLAALSHPEIDLALAIGFLSAVAVVLEIRNRKSGEIVPKDLPIVIENIAVFGMSICVTICIGIIVFLFGYVIVRGAPYINIDFLTKINFNFDQESLKLADISSASGGGILGYTFGSLIVTAVCEAIAIPLGLGAALYLSEYAKRNKITDTIRFFVETLAGLPSVIIGLLVFIVLVRDLNWGFTIQAAAIGLAIMILPFNIRVVEEALRSVPDAFREAAFALGATKWETAKSIVFYAASPGIITGILLGAGAAIGEAAVVFVIFGQNLPQGTSTNPTFPPLGNLFGRQASGFPTLPVLIFKAATLAPLAIGDGRSTLPGDVIYQNIWSFAFATAAVLITIYLAICVVALIARNRLTKKITGK